jgi:hypothetical protein
MLVNKDKYDLLNILYNGSNHNQEIDIRDFSKSLDESMKKVDLKLKF